MSESRFCRTNLGILRGAIPGQHAKRGVFSYRSIRVFELNRKTFRRDLRIKSQRNSANFFSREQEAQAADHPITSVYVNLSHGVFSVTGDLAYPQALPHGFAALKAAGVDGVAVPVAWGLVEADGPQQYDFGVYQQIAGMLRDAGLRMQPRLEFCIAEGIAGVPPWLLHIADSDPDIFFRDQYGNVLGDCLSIGVDNEEAVGGRSAIGIYGDLMEAFRECFSADLGSLITDVVVGAGPHGELRYPSYPRGRWHFPGVGEFQCYDRRMLESLSQAAREAGEPSWGRRGPQDAGHYCMWPRDTAFFADEGSWRSEYGDFFLRWYSEQLLQHGDLLLGAARRVFGQSAAVGLKLPVVHWWYHTPSHAAELTAGIYNSANNDGYKPIVDIAAGHRAFLQLSCAEMKNEDQRPEAKCGPEDIIQKVRGQAAAAGVPVGLENNFHRFDDRCFEQLRKATLDPSFANTKCLTYNAMGDELFKGYHWGKFSHFIHDLVACKEPPSAVQKAASPATAAANVHRTNSWFGFW
uniref:Beta-amylase n=1 Tax=Tetraselmis sp. GSL018 TaxID=582737 RepID=A0A061RBW3_9CHLO|eukprot:CAMPEP_0177584772 /NCGR_PEP_ID=MMETSP0419_2-20121207/4096_1 /TAXON_ID=582737 /ORGANISM="Tetraselmis sp., Strain GSL018" /LENGTH=521 /DNA_ID=CAMNT_0019074377 /DNA_START=178 /DNA_END=1743 /DNA_ORIENTATION=+